MAKIINITDKLSSEQPAIVIGDKSYPVNDGMETVLKYEELLAESSVDKMVQAVEISLGKTAADEIGVRKYSVGNFKVLTIAILAAMQGIEYTEAEARFQKTQQ